MRDMWNDVRHSARALVRARGFSMAAIATLALAIACQTSVIAIVNAYLVRSLPYPNSSRLYRASYAGAGEATPRGLSGLDWQAVSDVIEHPVAWDLDVFFLLGGDHAEAVPGAWVTPGFMQGLGIRAAFGRTFAPDEFTSGAPQTAMISHELWIRRFGGDSAVLGRRFDAYVSDRPDDPEVFTIVGVLPPDFWHVNSYTGVLTPLRAVTYPYLVTLREGVPPTLAASRMTALASDGGLAVPEGWRVELRSVHQGYASQVAPMLLAVAASVLLVLLTASANVAFLALLRGLRRRKEMAVRLALGAGRSRVARMLVTESAMLTSAAAVIGLLLSLVMLRQFGPAIERQLGRTVPGGTSALSIDAGVIVAVVALAAVIALGLAVTQVAVASRRKLYPMLRGGLQGGTDGPGGRRARSSLIALEIAGSLALLVAAGLMVRTVTGMLAVDLGQDVAGMASSGIALRERSYPDAEARASFHERLLLELRGMRGVTDAAIGAPSPLTEPAQRAITSGDGGDGAAISAGVIAVSPGYFDVLGIHLARGRAFAAQDRVASEPVAMVGESAALQLWPEGDALGRRVLVADAGGPLDPATAVARTIVGVVRDVRQSPADDQVADVYVPVLQVPPRFASLLIRASGAPERWTGEFRAILRAMDPEVSLGQVVRLEERAASQMARERFLAMLFTGFGLFALVLASIGVYGVVAFAVGQREHEIAVRMAVGADDAAITRLLAREGARALFAGIALGLAGALGIGRVLESQLHGVAASDGWTLVTASFALAAACAAATWWPARRACAIDPAAALRAE